MTPGDIEKSKIANFNHRQAFVASILRPLYQFHKKMLNYTKIKCLLTTIVPLKRSSRSGVLKGVEGCKGDGVPLELEEEGPHLLMKKFTMPPMYDVRYRMETYCWGVLVWILKQQ